MKSIKGMESQEREAFDKEMGRLASDGMSMREAAFILATKFPAYAINYETVKNRAHSQGIEFSSTAVAEAVDATRTRERTRVLAEELRQLQRVEAKRQEYVDTIANALVPYEPTPTTPLVRTAAYKPEHHWLLLFSDWHVGQSTPIQTCVTPETRVLTADLRWVPAGELKAGDAVLGFDEHETSGKKRAFQRATITAASRRVLPIYKIILASGEVLRATGEHKWVVNLQGNGKGGGRQWVRTDALSQHLSHHNRKSLCLPRFIRPWEEADCGYLAGAFDGEGSLRMRGRRLMGLAFSQKDNEMLSRVKSDLAIAGFAFDEFSGRGTNGDVHQLVSHNHHQDLRFLGQVRPSRLLARFQETTMPAIKACEQVSIVAVESDGEAEVAALSSSTQTYITEGFGSHNTGGIYEQSTEITRWQVEQMLRALHSIHSAQAHGYDIRKLLVVFNGDLLENDSMRASQARKVDRLVAQQAVEVFDLMGYTIRQLLALPGVESVEVHNVGGNHDRTSSKAGDAGLGELDYVDSWAWMLGTLLARAFEDEPRVSFTNWETYFGYCTLAGRKIIFEHGSSFRFGNSYGGIPWYPVVNAANKLVDMLGGGDLVLFGHLHQPAVLPIKQEGWVVINGALPATSTYIQSTFKMIRQPTQWLINLHEEHGAIEFHPLYAPPPSLQAPGHVWKEDQAKHPN